MFRFAFLATAAASTVKVDVYSEAGCEPCQYSIMHYFWPLFEQLTDVIEVEHFPFGNNYFPTQACGGSDGVYNITTRHCWAQTCVGTQTEKVKNPPADCFTGDVVQQHPSPEADVDRMEACAKELAGNWTQYWIFLNCMESEYFNNYFDRYNHTVETLTQHCVNGTGLNYKTLDGCYKGSDGDTAIAKVAQGTFDHDGVPAVYVNGKIVDPPNYQHSVLLGAICTELSDPKPDVCSAPTYPCWSDRDGGCASADEVSV